MQGPVPRFTQMFHPHYLLDVINEYNDCGEPEHRNWNQNITEPENRNLSQDNPEMEHENRNQNMSELFGDSCHKCGNITNYADDSTYYISDKSRETLQEKIISKLEKIKQFLVANRLTINILKTTITEIMLKQKRSKIKGSPPILNVRSGLKDKIITAKTECFLLGGYLQYNMSWQSQIETGVMFVLRLGHSKLGALRHCCQKLPHSSKLLLVNALIISRILYLLPVYGGTHRKYLDKLQVTINNAAQFVMGQGKRANKRTLMEMCNWLDIDELVI